MDIDASTYSKMTQQQRDRMTDRYLLNAETGNNNKSSHEYSYLTMKQQYYRNQRELEYWDSHDYGGWDNIRA